MPSLFQRIKERFWPTSYDHEEELFHQLVNHGCPDCGGTEFLEGPSASIAQNIKCDKCGSEYNIAPLMHFAERIRHVPKK